MPRVGRRHPQDQADNPKHKCTKCRHSSHHSIGPAESGSDFVTIQGYPVLTVGDVGSHKAGTCCGDNQWIAQSNATDHGVTVGGKKIFCEGDITLHDNKDTGKLVGGSDFVSCGS